MDKEAISKLFEQNVLYLQKTIPPDDIYVFAEQTLMAALFFLNKLRSQVDILAEMEKDKAMKIYTNNIMGLIYCRDEKKDIKLELDL